MNVLSLVFGLVLLASAPALAADVDGRWAGTIETPNGEVPIGFTFKADDKALTGTTTGPDGAEIAIKDGTVDGSNIAFKVEIDFGGMPFEISYAGVVSPAEIKLTLDFAGMPVEIVVKKAP
jgi:hypothetical protein